MINAKKLFEERLRDAAQESREVVLIQRLTVGIEQRLLAALTAITVQLRPVLTAEQAADSQVGFVMPEVVLGPLRYPVEECPQGAERRALARFVWAEDHMQPFAARAQIKMAVGEGTIGEEVEIEQFHAVRPTLNSRCSKRALTSSRHARR